MVLKISLIIFLACLSLACPAQNKGLDSLKGVLRGFEKNNTFTKDTNYLHTLIRISDSFFAQNVDSAYKYAQKNLQLSEQAGFLVGKAHALRQSGLAMRLKGNLPQAFEDYQRSLQCFEKLQNTWGLMTVHSQLGIVYEIQGQDPKALESHFKALSMAEKVKDIAGESSSLNNIGNIYKNQKNYSYALDYYQRSLVIKEKIGDKRGIGISLNNIANIYSIQEDLDKALAYNLRSLAIKEQIQDKRGICVSLGNIGEIYLKQKKPQEALQNYQKSLEIREALNDKQGISVSQNNISRAYVALGDFDKALVYAQKALQNAQEAHATLRISEAILSLYEAYEAQKDYNNALKYHKLYKNYADSLLNTSNEKKLANIAIDREKLEKERERLEKEAEIRKRQAIQKEQDAERLENLARNEKDKRIADSLHNLAQREHLQADRLRAEEARLRAESKLRGTELDKVKAENKLRDAQIKEAEEKAFFRTIINVLMFLGLLSVAIFSYFIFRSRQKEKRAKELVLVQKEEIQQINEELHITIEQVKEYSDVIEEKNKHITASIQYAQRIQQAILPLPEAIQKHLPDSFILFKPRDIVSGDFYYFHEQEGKLLLSAIDCTGHGVPGAFMTMIGYEILNEIIVNKQIISPDLILGELHKSIRKALKQAETNNKDGMDLSFVMIDKAQKRLTFAGAKNQMLYIQNNEIHELKADKMPIGGEQREAERIFTKQDIDISLPTSVYLFTDGYQDQFGGEKKQKFRIAQMKQLFLENHTQSPENQHNLYEKTIDNWMETGNEKQIDDILLIGVQL